MSYLSEEKESIKQSAESDLHALKFFTSGNIIFIFIYLIITGRD